MIMYGMSFNSKEPIVIDESMPSEVALISILVEFCRYLTRFLYRQDIVILCMKDISLVLFRQINDIP